MLVVYHLADLGTTTTRIIKNQDGFEFPSHPPPQIHEYISGWGAITEWKDVLRESKKKQIWQIWGNLHKAADDFDNITYHIVWIYNIYIYRPAMEVRSLKIAVQWFLLVNSS